MSWRPLGVAVVVYQEFERRTKAERRILIVFGKTPHLVNSDAEWISIHCADTLMSVNMQ